MVNLSFPAKTKEIWQKLVGGVSLALGLFILSPGIALAEHPPGWVATCGVFRVVFKLQQGTAEIHLAGEKGGYPIANGKIVTKGSSDSSKSATVTDFAMARFSKKGWLVGLTTYKEPKLYLHRDGKSDDICSPSIRILGR